MGRKSALTEKQWAAIEKRILEGEAVRALAREFDISEAAIRKRLGARTNDIKVVANQLVVAETAFSKLPISAQIGARTLADRLKAISMNLASAAEYGAATAHRLTGIAHAKVQEIDDADPFGKESAAALVGVTALTNLANLAAEIPMGLLKANKELIAASEKPGASGDGEGPPAAPEYKLTTDEPLPDAPIL